MNGRPVAAREATLHLVGDLTIVPIPDGLPGDAHGTGGQGDQLDVHLSAATRAVLVGGHIRSGEAHQALLCSPIDAGELATEDEVLAGALDGPGRLCLAGEGTRVDRGAPLQEPRLRVARVIATEVDTICSRRRRERALEGPRIGLWVPPNGRAVVRVTNRVQDVANGLDIIGVALAAVEPDYGTVVGLGREAALELARTVVVVAGPSTTSPTDFRLRIAAFSV